MLCCTTFGEVLDFWEHGGQGRRGRSGSVRRYRLWRHAGILESGAEEGRRAFGVTVLLEQHLDDLFVFVNRTVDVPPTPRHFDVMFHRPTSAAPLGAGTILPLPDTKEQTSAPSQTWWKRPHKWIARRATQQHPQN